MKHDMLDPLYAIDFYKVGHIDQYPEGTEMVYSNWTPRKSRVGGVNRVVMFGLQYYLIEYLKDRWEERFFDQSIDFICRDYEARMRASGIETGTDHLRDLHEVGYMPLEIYALPEGSLVPIGCPMLTVRNTIRDAFWLTNYIETQMSAVLWPMMTAATIAAQYREILNDGAERGGLSSSFVDTQGHDFSCRGMIGTEASALTGAGHLLSFKGTDTVQAIDLVESYYGAIREDVGGSIPATEHSVMCMGGKVDEIETFRRLITEIYPRGPVSIVSDTWDYWKVLTEVLPALKDEIMARDGTVVIRPDSGDPVDIVAGHEFKRGSGRKTPPEKGTFELLWETFGGVVNKMGFRELDPHIGAIYGDSITPGRAEAIQHRLIETGFAPTPVYGLGSFTYQYNTRDTFGFAMKATAGVVNGEVREIFKDPITDSGEKKSLKGFIQVRVGSEGEYAAYDQVSLEGSMCGEMKEVFRNGTITAPVGFGQVRERLADELSRKGLQ